MVVALPEEAAAAALVAAQGGQQAQGIRGLLQHHLLANGQHQLLQLAAVHQLQTAFGRGPVEAFPWAG